MKTKKTKNLNFCTCTFTFEKERSILSIEMLRKGRTFYRTTLKGVTSKFVSKFIKGFSEEEAKEINSLEMENI
jgi:polyhydroxyalkanoate synthesis regulator protein